MTTRVLSCFLLSSVSASGLPWGYETNGANWADAKVPNNECGTPGQSPIDLPSVLPSSRMIKAGDDNFQKIYTDQRDIKVNWEGLTSKVTLNG